jgi:hypothetical protein
MNLRKQTRRRGNTMIEFAIAMTFLIPLMVGSFSLGLNLMRSIQVIQVCRDAGSMYSRSVDFTLDGNKDTLVKMASGLGMTRTGGTGVVILSKVAFVSDGDCTAAGLTGSNCTNRGKYVFLQRIYVGAQSLKPSKFGTPSETGIDQTSRKIKDIYKDSSAQVSNFGNVMTLTSVSDVAFLIETDFKGVAWNLGNNVGNEIYQRAVF